MKFIDEDTGESQIDVVKIPEGVSLQISLRDPKALDDLSYISVIIKHDNIVHLIDFLHECRR